MFGVHAKLSQVAESLHVSVENAVIVISGELPRELKDEVVPAIRQAGVLGQVSDRIRVAQNAA